MGKLLNFKYSYELFKNVEHGMKIHGLRHINYLYCQKNHAGITHFVPL